jgi:AcrR family transcriptional regulator
MPQVKTPSRGAVAKRPGGRSARVRRAVFEATLDQLASRGYQSLTIDSVAAAAGVNKTTVYRNWPTKAKLVQAAAADRSEELIATEATGDAERDLVAMLRSVADYISSPIGQALVIAALNEAADPQVRQARIEFWKGRFEAAGELITSVAESGRAGGALDVEAVIEHLIGPLFLRAFVTGAPLDQGFIERTARTGVHLARCGAVDRS